jgi:endoglucanase
MISLNIILMLNIDNYTIRYSALTIFKLLRLMVVLVCFVNAKSTPTLAQSRAAAFSRAASLNNGISISWLEQTWDKKALTNTPVNNNDFKLLKKLGFKSVRLPVAFEYYASKRVPIASVLARVDKVLDYCKQNGLKLVIDYHYGKLNDTNYVAETQVIINIWNILTKRYLNESGNQLFFEIYNEPPPMNPQRWKDAAYNVKLIENVHCW